MKRLIRLCLIAIAIPAFIVFPLTGVLIAFWLLYLLVLGPLMMVGFWAFDKQWDLEHEIDSWKEGWLLPIGMFQWVWRGK